MLLEMLSIGAAYAVLFDKPPDMRFGSVKKKSNASRLQSLESFLCEALFFSLLA